MSWPFQAKLKRSIPCSNWVEELWRDRRQILIPGIKRSGVLEADLTSRFGRGVGVVARESAGRQRKDLQGTEEETTDSGWAPPEEGGREGQGAWPEGVVAQRRTDLLFRTVRRKGGPIGPLGAPRAGEEGL